MLEPVINFNNVKWIFYFEIISFYFFTIEVMFKPYILNVCNHKTKSKISENCAKRMINKTTHFINSSRFWYKSSEMFCWGH